MSPLNWSFLPSACSDSSPVAPPTRCLASPSSDCALSLALSMMPICGPPSLVALRSLPTGTEGQPHSRPVSPPRQTAHREEKGGLAPLWTAEPAEEAPPKEPYPMSLPPLVEPADALTRDEVMRYSRHLIIPDVAMAGQKRMKN